MDSRIEATTTLFQRLSQGDPRAEAELFERFYEELRRVAQVKLGHWERGAEHTLQPTALVGELYLRLQTDTDMSSIENRRHFFGIAGRALERILVDYHRQRTALKRGGGLERICLDEVLDSLSSQAVDVEALHEALQQLEQVSDLSGRSRRCPTGL